MSDTHRLKLDQSKASEWRAPFCSKSGQMVHSHIWDKDGPNTTKHWVRVSSPLFISGLKSASLNVRPVSALPESEIPHISIPYEEAYKVLLKLYDISSLLRWVLITLYEIIMKSGLNSITNGVIKCVRLYDEDPPTINLHYIIVYVTSSANQCDPEICLCIKRVRINIHIVQNELEVIKELFPISLFRLCFSIVTTVL